MDLWSKVLAERRRRLGSEYRGDVDAPRVVVVSEPALGLSMDLEANSQTVWAALERSARTLTAECDVWAIACNTLNYFAPRLEALGLDALLVTPQAAVARRLAASGSRRVGLLGARPVAELGPFSPYLELARELTLDTPTPADRERLHLLIEEIKLTGRAQRDHADRLGAIIDALPDGSDPVLLACTELPLVELDSDRELLDVTALVAEELVSFR